MLDVLHDFWFGAAVLLVWPCSGHQCCFALVAERECNAQLVHESTRVDCCWCKAAGFWLAKSRIWWHSSSCVLSHYQGPQCREDMGQKPHCVRNSLHCAGLVTLLTLVFASSKSLTSFLCLELPFWIILCCPVDCRAPNKLQFWAVLVLCNFSLWSTIGERHRVLLKFLKGLMAEQHPSWWDGLVCIYPSLVV